MTGVDLSPAMVDEARRRFPHLTFSVGDLNGLLRPPAAAGWGAVTAWYALVHLAGSELAPAVASLARVLVPGGWLALALHAGAAVHHAEELMDQPVDVDFVLHDPDEVVAAVRAAGLVDVEWYLRGPLAGRGRDRAALRAGAAPGLTPQSRRCISSARSTSRKPRRSLTAFIGGVDAGDDGEDVAAVGEALADGLQVDQLEGQPEPVAAVARAARGCRPGARARRRPR